jgi:hypothetical protein
VIAFSCFSEGAAIPTPFVVINKQCNLHTLPKENQANSEGLIV